MSRKIVVLIFCSILLALTGCAKDENGRAYYDSRGGSLKDTSLVGKNKYYNKNATYKKYSYNHKAYRSVPQKRKADSNKPKLARQNKNVALEKQITLEESKKHKNPLPSPTQEKPEQKLASVMLEEQGSTDEGDVTDLEHENIATPVLPVEADIAPKAAPKSDETSKAIKSEVQKDTPKHKEVGGADQNKKASKTAESKVKSSDKQNLALHMGRDPEEAKPGKAKSRKLELNDDGKSAFHVVKVYYATDRNLSGQSAPKKVYGGKRSSISYGHCEISIPRTHKIGEIEKPSVWRLEFSESAKKHVVLKKVKRHSKRRFFKDIEKNVKLSHGKNAFVFIHGYNIEFHEAALRTAQIAHDIKFDGAPIFYSWPSKGGYKDYTRDEANVLWSQTNIKNFLRDFVTRSDAKNIYLIAHSMGARALTGALADLAQEMPSIRKRIKEVLLAAPDIDAEVFKRDIAPKLVKASGNITLYASADDKALQASYALHGEPRAGDAGDNLLVINGIDTIDASGIDTSLFGHAYFAEVPTIVTDMLAIIKHGRRPRYRSNLIPVLAADGQYWAFRRNKTIIINGTTLLDKVTKEVEH